MTEEEFIDRHHKAFYSLRWEHRMSQAAVAQKAKVSPELISKIERGVTHPNLRRTFRIAAAFGMSASEYLAYVESGEILAYKKEAKSAGRYRY